MDVMRIKRQRTLWVEFFLLLAFCFFAGCGSGGNSTVDSADSGGIAFEIKWPEVNTLSDSDSATKSTATDQCLDGTISYVVFAIYDRDGNLLVDLDDATFDCEAEQGVVAKVPAQSGIRLVVLGLGYDEETTAEDILLRGEYDDDITVEVGKTTRLGAIQTYEFISGQSRPILGTYIKGFENLTFEWTEARGASSYKITINRHPPAGAAPIEVLTSDISVSLSSSDENFFANAGMYSWAVAPVDAYGNYGKEAELRYFNFNP